MPIKNSNYNIQIDVIVVSEAIHYMDYRSSVMESFPLDSVTDDGFKAGNQ